MNETVTIPGFNSDAIEIISFAPTANRRRLVGPSFSIWNTSEKACGITFSSYFFERYIKGLPKKKNCLSIAYNNLTADVYLIFTERSEIVLNEVGKKENESKNLTCLRRDVVNKLSQLLTLDYTDPKKKQHHIFWMEKTTNPDVWEIKEQLVSKNGKS